MKEEDLEKIRKLLEDYSKNTDSLGISGIGVIRELDSDTGEELKKETVYNTVVVDAGLEDVADAIHTGTSTDWSHIAIGSDGTSPSEGDTSLGVFEEAESVSSSLVSYEDGGVTGDTVVQFGPVTFDAGAGKSSIEETAIQDGGTDTDSIFNRMTFDAINNEDNDLEITIYIDVGGRGYSP